MKCPSEQWQVQQNQPLCLCFHGFQPRVGMHTNMFAFSKMQTVECSHNDKDRFSLKSPSVCFLHHVFLAGSESCNGNIRIIFGCHCLQYASQFVARAILSSACLCRTGHRQFQVDKNTTLGERHQCALFGLFLCPSPSPPDTVHYLYNLHLLYFLLAK